MIKVPDEMWARIEKEIQIENKRGKRYYTSPTQFILNSISHFFGFLEDERKE